MAIVSKKPNHLLWPLLLLLCFLGCQSPERTRPADIVKAYRPILVDANASVIIVDVRIGDRSYPFALDTGVSYTVFDVKLREKLGKSIGLSTIIGTGQRVPAFKAIDAYIGDISVRSEGVILCLDLSAFSNALGTDIYGLIGMSSISKYRLFIDKANGFIRLENSSIKIHKSWGKGWKIHFRYRKPYVYIDEMGEEFLIDTGDTSSGILSNVAFKKAIQREGLSPMIRLRGTISGIIERRAIRTFAIRLMGMEYHGLRFSEGKAGVLGMGFLAKHTVLLDFKGGRMYLKKGKRFGWPDRIHRTGMVLGFIGNTIKVLQVVTKGKADRLGIVKGDVIEYINGIGMKDMTLGSIDRLFEKDEVTINLIRDGQRKAVVFSRKKSKR